MFNIIKSKCELCGGPLSERDWLNKESGECSGYCSKCIHPEGKLFDIVNYFHFAVQESPLLCYKPDGKTEVVEWPHPKCPALWHKMACKHFPLWGDIVSNFKILKNIKYFDIKALREFVNWVIANVPEKSAEQAMITRVDMILKMIREELDGERAEASRAVVADLLASQNSAALPAGPPPDTLVVLKAGVEHEVASEK